MHPRSRGAGPSVAASAVHCRSSCQPPRPSRPGARASRSGAVRRVVAPLRALHAGARRPARPRRRPRRRVGGRHGAAQRPRRERALRLRPGPRGEPPRTQPRRRNGLGCRPRRRPLLLRAQPRSRSSCTPRASRPSARSTASSAQLAKQPASARKNGTGPNAAANYPPLYYAYEAVAYELSPARSLLGRMFFMRLATTLLLVVTVWLTWLIAAELLRPHVGARAGDRAGRAAAQARLRRRDHQPRPHARDGGHGRAAHGSAARAPRPDARARAVAGGLRRAPGALVHPRGLFLPPFAVDRARRSRCWRYWPGRRRALGFAAAVVGDHVRLRRDRIAWSQAHAGRRHLREPGRRLQRAPVRVLPVAVLPAQAQRHGPQGRTAGLRLPPGLHRLLLQRVRLVQRQLPAGSSSTSCRSSPGSGSSRCGPRS